MHENTKKTGEIIFSVTQNRTFELPQLLRDFDDYALMWIENYIILCNFENCQNHSYLLITNCTRGRAISYTNEAIFSGKRA